MTRPIILKKILKKTSNLFFVFLNPKMLHVFLGLFLDGIILSLSGSPGKRSKAVQSAKAAICIFDFSQGCLKILEKSKSELAPHSDIKEFLKEVLMRRSVKIKNFMILPDQSDAYLSNLEWQRKSELPKNEFQLNYHNLDYYSQAQTKGPVIILSWHHGTYALGERALTEKIPDMLRLSHAIYPYKHNLSVAVAANPLRSMMIAHQALSSNKPIFSYFDGVFGSRPWELELYGDKIYLASALLDLARSHRAAVLPFTSYVNQSREVDLFLGDNLFPEDRLSAVSNPEALGDILNYFKEDMKKRCPWAVNPCILEELMNPAIRRQ